MFAVMDIKLGIFAAVLLISVGATRTDLGPQKFTEYTPHLDQPQHNPRPNEVILYLTRDQIQALESGGAVVRAADPEPFEPTQFKTEGDVNNNEPETPDNRESDDFEYKEIDDSEYKESDDADTQIENTQSSDENNLRQNTGIENEAEDDVDFEEIVKFLNDGRLEENNGPRNHILDKPQIIEQNIEEVREINPRFVAHREQEYYKQQDQNISGLKDNKANKNPLHQLRNVYPKQQNEQVFLPQIQESTDLEKRYQQVSQKSVAAERRFKLIPYEVVENVEEATTQEPQPESEELQPDEQNQEAVETEKNIKKQQNDLLSRLLSSRRFSKENTQQNRRLIQNELELQAALLKLSKTPKYNDQKYAIEIEKLRANIEKQNTLAKAVSNSVVPQLIKKEIEKSRLNSSSGKQANDSARNTELPRLKPKRLETSAITNPVSDSSKKQKQLRRPAVVDIKNNPVKAEQLYSVERVAPLETGREILQNPVRKNERITIFRHIWEH